MFICGCRSSPVTAFGDASFITMCHSYFACCSAPSVLVLVLVHYSTISRRAAVDL